MAEGNRPARAAVEQVMEFDEYERAALIAEGADPDDPAVQAAQQRISNLLRCHGIWLLYGEP
ncbi:hypothetical protein ACFXO9_30570 [Nocardia tengchongensis]|uniref:hypothetical protein n=1 Tax=Nocardia tengchongensis TaxID=2055889 RepID=UPI00368B17C0